MDFGVNRLTMSVIYVSFGDNPHLANQLYKEAYDLDTDPLTYAKAVDLYLRAIQLKPNFVHAIINLGSVKFRQGFVEEAVELFRKAITFEDCPPEGYHNLGHAIFNQDGDNLFEAIVLFKKAVDLDDLFEEAHFNLALAYERTGFFKDAQKHWKRYIELDPDSPSSCIARRYLRV